MLENAPANSHLQIDFLTFTVPSTVFMNDLWNTRTVASRRTGPLVTYVLLEPDADPASVELKLTDLASSAPARTTDRITYYLQP